MRKRNSISGWNFLAHSFPSFKDITRIFPWCDENFTGHAKLWYGRFHIEDYWLFITLTAVRDAPAAGSTGTRCLCSCGRTVQVKILPIGILMTDLCTCQRCSQSVQLRVSCDPWCWPSGLTEVSRLKSSRGFLLKASKVDRKVLLLQVAVTLAYWCEGVPGAEGRHRQAGGCINGST